MKDKLLIENSLIFIKLFYMLASLKIKDIAIMDELDINFCPHLNIITGETGAGCSCLCRQVFF